jgi:hypothetical protein
MIRPVGTGADVTKPEYQHFIPQFSLRNFSHKYEGGTKKAENLYNKTKVVNVMNLSEDGPRFIVKAVKRTFGHFDMYCDKFALTPTQKRHVESELGKLESGISSILQRILPACDDDTDIISLSRHEEFVLKKFTFVMKYRSTLFFERYNHTSLRDYTSTLCSSHPKRSDVYVAQRPRLQATCCIYKD